MKKTLRFVIVLALAAIVFIAAFALNAGAAEPTPGGEGDPLVTLSYLEQVFKGYITEQLQRDLEEKTETLRGDLEERIAALEEASHEARILSASTFQLLELKDGQTLVGQRGTELLLRVGSAEVAAQSSPGLVDTTTAGTLEGGAALEKNHLYMITIPENGIKAKGNVMIIVRGDYEVK
jgi:hypothetical protein